MAFAHSSFPTCIGGPFRPKTRSPQVRNETFRPQPPNLRRQSLVAGALQSVACSPRLAPPLIRFLCVGSDFRSPLLSAFASRHHLAVHLRFLQPVASEDLHLQASFHAGHTTTKKQPRLKKRGRLKQLFSEKRFGYCFENVTWSIRMEPFFGLELISSNTKTSSFKEFQFSIRRNFSNGIEIFCHWSVTPLTI